MSLKIMSSATAHHRKRRLCCDKKIERHPRGREEPSRLLWPIKVAPWCLRIRVRLEEFLPLFQRIKQLRRHLEVEFQRINGPISPQTSKPPPPITKFQSSKTSVQLQFIIAGQRNSRRPPSSSPNSLTKHWARLTHCSTMPWIRGTSTWLFPMGENRKSKMRTKRRKETATSGRRLSSSKTQRVA